MHGRITGPKAGSVKYDILTAMTVAGLHGSQGQRASMLRLAAIVTARYNWSRDELSMGQAEMARLWAVDERTAKREVKRLLTGRILLCTRPGVRGRVAAYRLNIAEICRLSEPVWTTVGADFTERMRQLSAPEAVAVVPDGAASPAEVAVPAAQGRWGEVQKVLRDLDPAGYSAWFSKLDCISDDDGTVQLGVRSGFVGQYIETHLDKTLRVAVAAVFGPGQTVTIRAGAA
ncbi:DnaA N-terminal domain-containing protein [Oceaniglobus indicus]|uniref:DnaA N-terminal domain-containing protein n=1 Tax=Oceaniglobus indicus TaxID=2047749 RepID=UPI000C1A6657|nr:DnaA N-terminal domain-containing protein [Oceaniglobus indicus]